MTTFSNTQRVLVQAQTDEAVAIGGVTYASSDDTIARVSFQDGANAWVEGVAAGTASIAASRGGYVIDDLEVTVTEETPEPPEPIHGSVVVVQGPEPK